MPRVKRGVTARASHKKILKQAKGIMVLGLEYFVLPSKLLSKQASTPIATAAKKSGSSVRSGLPALMPVRVNVASVTVALLTA